MDPTANLREQLELASRFLLEWDASGDDDSPYSDADTFNPHDVARLAELVIALDEWMQRGGYPPRQWNSQP